MADADFAPGDLVLRERFLLIGPAELPPLQMFRPVPHDIGTVEIAGEATATLTCADWFLIHIKSYKQLHT